jgi:hypothetical protein
VSGARRVRFDNFGERERSADIQLAKHHGAHDLGKEPRHGAICRRETFEGSG